MASTPLTAEQIDDLIFDTRAGELEVVQEFLNTHSGEQLLQVKDEYSLATPLHMASGNGHIEIVKLLLAKLSGDELVKFVKAENDSGNTALHWASLNGHLEVVKLLCDAGSDPFSKNKAGHDSFYEAEVNEQETVIDYLLERYSVEPEDDDEPESSSDAAASAATTTTSTDEVASKVENLSVGN
ncbi:Yar1p [Sugiyamaella lignohabitans]|uniref:Yar1p n=1 Tax=Sugiyamaella lignohabitans TaxID=796027 RepID=A0A161HLF4_9ASCO|nr:Yar1p [Sugiyamaella lignohabitans]ANB12888.1 Yar1p [Sugiyamaella lignohabitans]